MLPGDIVTFAWLGTSDVGEYWREVGSSAAGNDLYGASQGLSMTVTVTDLPRGGRALSVRLWARVGDQWSFGDVPDTAVSLVDDHGSDVENAMAVAVGMAAASVVTVGGSIERGEGADWFSFVAVAGARYTFATDLGTRTDMVLDLLDGKGAVISSNDDFGASNESRIDWPAPGGGTYFLAVRTWSPTQIGTYTLAVTTVVEPSEGHGIKAVLANFGRIDDILEEVISTYSDPSAAVGDGTYLRGRVEAVRQEKLETRHALPSLFPDISGDTTPAQLLNSFDSWYFRFSALAQ
ncbi:MAG TPA: PPC domain-containing protein [Dehalococcoidia bacterium]|nr:PPC domain-containing protein [Dehalococcoidia bacterium]